MSKPEREPILAASVTSEHAAIDAAQFASAQRLGTRADEGSGLYRLLVESVRDYAIFALDPAGYVMSWNAGAERLKGYTPDEIIGKHFSRFFPPVELANRKPERQLRNAELHGCVEDEGWRVRKDGTQFWAHVVVTALRDNNGQLVGFAKVTRDLTERVASRDRELDDTRRIVQSEEANSAKSDFLAAMSHELRTPLNAIGGYADLLLSGAGGDVSAQQRQYLSRIRAGQQHLLALVNDIMNFSRLEAGQTSYDIGRVSLVDVIDGVLLGLQGEVEKRHLSIVRMACDDPFIKADRAKVEQVLLRLLLNAIKFTGENGTITVECVRNGACIELSVRDTGIGIAADQLEQIFLPFVQVGRSLKNTREGAGLGLAISSDIAHAMGGELSVQSIVGKGSVFTLSLPAADAERR